MLGVLAPCVKRSSMSSLIREFFYTHAEELLELCVMKRRPPQLLPVLQALLAIDAVWERKPIRRFLQGDKVLVEWPQATGNWVTGVVHKCRYDVNVVSLSRCVAAYPSCQRCAREDHCKRAHMHTHVLFVSSSVCVHIIALTRPGTVCSKSRLAFQLCADSS